MDQELQDAQDKLLSGFEEVEHLWDDTKGVKLPEITSANSAGKSIYDISEELIVINNHLADFAKFEPPLTNLITELETTLYLAKREIGTAFEKDLSARFDEMPADQRKNLTLQSGWIKNKLEMKYNAFETVIKDSNMFLVKVRRLYEMINRRIVTCHKSIDVGRAILYSLKTEAKIADL